MLMGVSWDNIMMHMHRYVENIMYLVEGYVAFHNYKCHSTVYPLMRDFNNQWARIEYFVYNDKRYRYHNHGHITNFDPSSSSEEPDPGNVLGTCAPTSLSGSYDNIQRVLITLDVISSNLIYYDRSTSYYTPLTTDHHWSSAKIRMQITAQKILDHGQITLESQRQKRFYHSEWAKPLVLSTHTAKSHFWRRLMKMRD